MSRLRVRPYRAEADYRLLRRFLQDVLLAANLHPTGWDAARLDYWRWHGLANISPMPLEQVVWIWEDQDGAIAAALHPEGPGEAFLEVHPTHRGPELDEAMIEMAEERLAAADDGRRELFVWAAREDQERRALLSGRGYEPGARPEYRFRQPLREPPPGSPLPAGYRLGEVGEGPALGDRCYASGLAFHQNDLRVAENNRADVSWYRSIQRAPLYRPDLDLVVQAPDGAVAAFTTVWFDPVTRTGVFEPVGTVPDHQQRGLGKALLREGLRRLHRLGAQMAYVGAFSSPARALYESVGFADYDLWDPWYKTW